MTENLLNKRTYDIAQPGEKAQKQREMLNRPEIYAKVMEMAADLEKVLGSTAQLLQSVKPGARFRDKKSKTILTYDALVQPYVPDQITELVLESAGKPWTQYMQPAFIVMSELIVDTNSGKQIMEKKTMLSTRDFVKIIAVGRWEILDYGPQDSDTDWPSVS